MTPPSDSSRTSTVRIEFWYLLSPETIRPVWPPEMPKTISIPASSRTRATSALAGISSVSICSMAIATSSLGGWRAELASSGGLRQRSRLVENIRRIDPFPSSGRVTGATTPRRDGMPILKIPDGEIYYEVHGSGFPLMIFAPGGLRSELAFWRHSPSNPTAPAPWMDPMAVLGDKYRVVAMDQRNAGRSRTQIDGSDDWHIYAADHLALADHLGLDRFHVMGGCIGGSFCLTLF